MSQKTFQTNADYFNGVCVLYHVKKICIMNNFWENMIKIYVSYMKINCYIVPVSHEMLVRSFVEVL
jgi:hypothetical protein